MPKPLPPDIARLVAQHAPPGHRIAQVRCHLLKPPTEIERPFLKSQLLLGRKPPIEHDTALELRDVDTGEGWDVRLIGVGHDIVMGDIFTALSPLPPGEDRVRKLAYLLNHKTGQFVRTYPDIATAGKLLNELAYKRSLSFWSPATVPNRAVAFIHTLKGYYLSAITPAADRFANIVATAAAAAFVWLLLMLGPGGLGASIIAAAMVHPWLLALIVPAGLLIMTIIGLLLALPLMVLGALLYYLLTRLTKAVFEPPRFKGSVEYSFAELIGWDNLRDWWRFSRTDATYLLQEVGVMLHRHAQNNPEPKLRFVVGEMRGQATKGMLPPEEPPQEWEEAA